MIGDCEVARLSVRLGADLAPAVALFVRETGTRLGMPMGDAEKLAGLVEEACNVVSGAPNLQVVIQRRLRQVVVTLECDSAVDIPQSGVGCAGLQIGSLLSRKFADRLTFSLIGHRIARLEIARDLPLWDMVPDTSIPPLVRVGEADEGLEFRPMRADEGRLLARLFHRCYGWGYVRDVVYSPEAIRRYLLSGRLVSYVAVRTDGEFVGHVAVERENTDDPVGEMVMGLVDPRYRGRKVLERLSWLVVDHASRVGMSGVCAEAVMSHTYSQRSARALGFRETAVLLGLIPGPERCGQGNSRSRLSVMYMYRTFHRQPEVAVYLPEQHGHMLRRIYANAGMSRRYASGADRVAGLPAMARCDLAVESKLGRAHLSLTGYRQDTEEVLLSYLKLLGAHHLEYIDLDLPLEEPATLLLVGPVQSAGFSFAGVIPETRRGDMLRFQHVSKESLGKDDLETASEFGRELVKYVCECALQSGSGISSLS